MTLNEMAEYVCGVVRQSAATDIRKAKEFLRQRYRMIASEELWKDLLFQIPFTFDMAAESAGELFGPNFFSRDAGIWHLPSSVDKVLALRTDEHGIDVTDGYQFFRTSLDEFTETGDPVKFTVEHRVVADLRGKLAEIEATGVAIYNAAADNQAYKVRYLDLDGEARNFVGTFSPSATPSATFSPQVILSATKLATSGSAYFALDGVEIALAASTDTEWKSYPTIRIFPRPTASLDLRVMVKRKCIDLTDDGDSPEIDGVDNCLMTFAQVDMLKRARQYGKAGAVTSEALALLNQLKVVAVAQQAQRTQVVPIVGEVSGSVWDGVGNKGYW